MDREITKKIWQLRNKEKVESYPHPVNLIYTGERTYQLYFATIGCSRACAMCYYGFCRTFDEEKAQIEDYAREIGYIVASDTTYTNNALVYYLEQSNINYYDQDVYDYFETTYPELFEED